MAVLTIQSHVVAGHVGNSAAVFCLERSGIETWRLNTLQFSNHTAAVGWTGEVFSIEHLRNVLAGLEKVSGFANCDAVLSGYLGAAELGDVVLETVEKVRAANPKAVYCCDTVMGDGGEIYVDAAIPRFMREKAVPAADIITPNAWELGWLTDTVIADEKSAIAAARKLLAGSRLKMVVSTGLKDPRGLAGVCVTQDGVWEVVSPRADFNAEVCCGAGDITTAVFLANWLKTGDPGRALSAAVSAIYGLIARTVAAGKKDIDLIGAQDEIVRPSLVLEARRLA